MSDIIGEAKDLDRQWLDAIARDDTKERDVEIPMQPGGLCDPEWWRKAEGGDMFALYELLAPIAVMRCEEANKALEMVPGSGFVSPYYDVEVLVGLLASGVGAFITQDLDDGERVLLLGVGPRTEYQPGIDGRQKESVVWAERKVEMSRHLIREAVDAVLAPLPDAPGTVH